MEIEGTVFIARPASEVYRYVMDVSNDKHWRQGVEESGYRSGEAFRPGSIGYTRMGDVEVEWKVQSFKPGESVEWELLNGPFKGYEGYQFQPIGNGTQFTFVSRIQPTGVSRLLGPLLGGIRQRRNQEDVEALRDILESANPISTSE